eukprot:5317681-Prymnesium_polylepis.1
MAPEAAANEQASRARVKAQAARQQQLELEGLATRPCKKLECVFASWSPPRRPAPAPSFFPA